MGNKFEVYSYVDARSIKNPYYCPGCEPPNYQYERVYAGEIFEEALSVAMKEKEKGVGCVKLEWR